MNPMLVGIMIGVIIGTSMGIIAAGLLAGAKCGECGISIQRWLDAKAK